MLNTNSDYTRLLLMPESLQSLMPESLSHCRDSERMCSHAVVMPCKHVVCLRCLAAWFADSGVQGCDCPACRLAVTKDLVTLVLEKIKAEG